MPWVGGRLLQVSNPLAVATFQAPQFGQVVGDGRCQERRVAEVTVLVQEIDKVGGAFLGSTRPTGPGR